MSGADDAQWHEEGGGGSADPDTARREARKQIAERKEEARCQENEIVSVS